MKRGRPLGPDIKKIQLILDVLYQYPSGVWLRQISKISKLPVSTVHFYLSHYFEPFIENIGFKTESGRYLGFRLIKLKRMVNAADIFAYINLKRSIKSITS
ncbi:MAG: hypothetical protein QXF15_03030 [Candidatus Aenigmatarchaeota archaeon]|nr:hypothetical protein [Candidatus Aenigmarchaeota archaeon]